MSTIGLWTDLEGHVGLWCGCFPAFQPILRSLFKTMGLSRLISSAKESRTGYGTNGPTSGSRGWNRSNAIPLSSRPQNTNVVGDDHSSQKGIFPSDSDLPRANSDVKSGAIMKNTQVEVFYEQRGSSADEDNNMDWGKGRRA